VTLIDKFGYSTKDARHHLNQGMLILIELGTRHIYLAGCTINLDLTWVTQQARQFVWNL
jgi:hypothetical protein